MAKKSPTRKPVVARTTESFSSYEPVAVAAQLDAEPPEPLAWKMPQPTRGQLVVFYHRATVSENNADIAHVMRVGEKSIEVAFRGQGYVEVLHKDDTRFSTNPDLRMDVDGVWDFTDEKKYFDEQIESLGKRISKLEAR